MNRTISVVIPTFNESKGITALISYLRKSSPGIDHEIIVVDGGSTDGTIEKVLQTNCTLIESTRKGRGVQLNEGAAAAQGDVLVFIHADSRPPANYLYYILQALENDFDAGCFRLKFDSNNWFLKANAWFTRFNINAVRFGDQGLFVTREQFEKNGGYRNDHIVMEDQEIVRRLRRHGARFKVLPHSMLTSARKYDKNGAVYLQYIFFLVWLNYYRGRSQEELIRLYKKRIKDSKIKLEDAQPIRSVIDDICEKPSARKGENSPG